MCWLLRREDRESTNDVSLGFSYGGADSDSGAVAATLEPRGWWDTTAPFARCRDRQLPPPAARGAPWFPHQAKPPPHTLALPHTSCRQFRCSSIARVLDLLLTPRWFAFAKAHPRRLGLGSWPRTDSVWDVLFKGELGGVH